MHPGDLLVEIKQRLPDLHRAYYRLGIVVGQPGSGKTQLLRALQTDTGHPLLNVNLEIGRRLLDHVVADRPRLVPDLLRETVVNAGSQVVLLDNTEMLFDPALQLHPLQVLQSVSRNVTVVASWSGHYSADALVYAEPWHREYRRYPCTFQDALIFTLD